LPTFFIEHHYFNLTDEATSWFRNLYKSADNKPENSIIMAMNLCRTSVFIRQNYHLMLKTYYQERWVWFLHHCSRWNTATGSMCVIRI